MVIWIVKLESRGSRLSLPYKGRICEMLCDLSTGESVRCSYNLSTGGSKTPVD